MKSFLQKTILASCALLSALMSIPTQATWYDENVETGSQLMMMDIRWPFFGESTYYANWNFETVPAGFSCYGGFGAHLDTVGADHRPNLDAKVQESFHPGSVWSFWGHNKDGEPVRPVAFSPYCYPLLEGGEGAKGLIIGQAWSFISVNHWYTMMVRTWDPVGVKDPNYSYVGRWVKDVDGKAWHLYGVQRIPASVKAFRANAGFCEDFGNGGRSVRSMHRRLGYSLKNGKWFKSNDTSYAVPEKTGQMDTYWVINVLPEEDHEVLAMELSSNLALLPMSLKGEPLELGKTHHFVVKQPDAPILDLPQVDNVKAQTNGKQVLVSWEVPPSASPQLAYKIEVFDNPECQGSPKVVREERMPSVQTVLLDAPVTHPHVRLTLSDVFDQVTKPVVVHAEIFPKRIPAITTTADAGLEYELIHQDQTRHENYFFSPLDTYRGLSESHYWLSLSELEKGRCVQKGVANGFDVNLRGDRNVGYGFKFRGLLRVPADGVYLFHLQICDGYRLALDGKEVLVYDGTHGPAEKTIALDLGKGDHPLELDNCVDMPMNNWFKVEWEGPGLARAEIPTSALFHVKTSEMPQIEIKAQGGKEGNATVEVNVDAKGHLIAKTTLYLGKMQIAETKESKIVYKGCLPDGENRLWVRVVFDKEYTMDSPIKKISVSSPPIKDWTLTAAADANALHSLTQPKPDSFSFLGDGEFFLSRKIKGDFTLTCRVDACAGLKGEPVNGLSWVGLTVREYGEKSNFAWGNEFGIMQTGAYGLLTTPNNSDLGGNRISSYRLPENRPWLRVVRHGIQWTAWHSADGKTWELGALYLKPIRDEVDAGLIFRSTAQGARTYFQAAASNLKLEAGIAKGMEVPTPPTAKNTGGERLTGVVMSKSNPQVVVARSSKRGLLLSDNGGKTWKPVNGHLSGVDNQVRSVAIHPTNPQVMLRASSGGLALTKDGGKHWEKLVFAGDFDGQGPSALCGEVVAFDLKNPDILYAGTESKGFWRSMDGGKTWAVSGAVGERITAIVTNPWWEGKAGLSMLHVTTCQDVWMPLLGRGKSAQTTSANASKNYTSFDSGQTLEKLTERTDLGYLNIAPDKGTTDSLACATTHGMVNSNWAGRVNYLLPLINKEPQWLRPVTALTSSANLSDARMGVYFNQALDPVTKGGIAKASTYFDLNWDWVNFSGDIPVGGLISISSEMEHGQEVWLLATDGLYHSLDSAVTLKKVLDEKGNAIK